jgi:4-aminobutyrate aminotransferase-like enzyme
MRFWNSSNISQVLRIRPNMIAEHHDLEQLFAMFEDIVEKLHQRKD